MALFQWELEWGDRIEFLLTRKRKGLKAEALDKRPERSVISEWYIKALFTMRSSAGRLGPPSMFEPSLKPITLVEMKAYSDMFGVISTLKEFVFTIQALDRVYITHMEKLRHARKHTDNSFGRRRRTPTGKGIS